MCLFTQVLQIINLKLERGIQMAAVNKRALAHGLLDCLNVEMMESTFTASEVRDFLDLWTAVDHQAVPI